MSLVVRSLWFCFVTSSVVGIFRGRFVRAFAPRFWPRFVRPPEEGIPRHLQRRTINGHISYHLVSGRSQRFGDRRALPSDDDDPVDGLLTSPSVDDRGFALSTPLDRPLLAVIDASALLLFAGVGKASHSADDSNVLGVLATAFPFLSTWFATSPLTGVYDKKSNEGKADSDDVVKDALFQTLPGWAIAVPLGCFLRGVIKGYPPPIPFVIVTLIATLVLLGGARVLFGVAEDFVAKLGAE